MDMLKEEKKRVFLIVVLIILIIVYTFELISLGILKKNEGKRLDEDIVDKEIYYTISFDEDNGSQLNHLKIKENDKLELYVPVKEGFIFNGWTLNEEIIYNGYVVTDNLLLKALWKTNDEVLDEYITTKDEYVYSDDFVNIEIFIPSELNSDKIDYIKVNNSLIYSSEKHNPYSFKIFKFNNNYIIHLISLGKECDSEIAFIINQAGILIGKIEGENSKETLVFNRITFNIEKNTITNNYYRTLIDKDNMPYKSITYKIINNQLEKIEN